MLNLLLAFLFSKTISGAIPTCNGGDDQVYDLPGYPSDAPKLTMYSGFVPVDSSVNGSLYYWFIESELGSDPSIPLLIWLNGGPGASSLTGLLAENGPFRINDDLTLSYNPYSWVTQYHMLFIDNPIGTGFSFCDEGGWVTTEQQMAEDFVTFLEGWFQCSTHQKYAESPLYITGESYAGRYIPWIAHQIIVDGKKSELNLAGLAIGNGIWNPIIQFPSSAQYAYNLGIINYEQMNQVLEQVDYCLFTLNQTNCTAASIMCETVTNDIYSTMGGNIFQYNVYMLDETVFDGITQDISDYLAQPDVAEALNTLGIPWKSSDGTSEPNDVNNALACDILQDNTEGFVEEILSHNVRILFYNGQLDGSVCNNYGNQLCLNKLNYGGDWMQRTKYAYQTSQGGKMLTGGYAMESADQKLTYFVVSDSGHLVPYDQPETILDVITNWISGGSWDNQ